MRIVAYAGDSTLYCPDHGDDKTMMALYSWDESGDCPDTCDECHALLDTSWTAEATRYARETVSAWIKKTARARCGECPEHVAAYAERLRWCGENRTAQAFERTVKKYLK